jgi:hypothetical protein
MSVTAETPPSRLIGWKEIASYLQKGIRTVQRWEKELGLPVHRVNTGKGEVVYALPAELDAWLARADSRRQAQMSAADEEDEATHGADASATGEDVRGRPGRASRRRTRVAALLCAVALGIAGLAWHRWATRPEHSQPYSFKIENHALRVFAEDGRFLWQHRFSAPLHDDRYTDAAVQASRLVIIQDLDGDGTREVLFHTAVESPTDDEGLFCFNSDGSLRFTHRPSYTVHFGDAAYSGPWRPSIVTVIPDESGAQRIWLASHHYDEFPTVVEKLDPQGAVLGRFWNDGQIIVLQPFVLDGRRVVLAGGCNNDVFGATLAVIDAARPDGRAPAVRPAYLCTDCPSAWPLEFFALPPTDIQRAIGNVTSAVDEIRVGPDGSVMVDVASDISPVVPERGPTHGQVRYFFDAHLRPVRAEIESSFRLVHDELYRRHLLDHAAGPRDEHDLWPILRWTSRGFEQVAPPATK